MQHELELHRTALSKRCRREELHHVAGANVHAQKGRVGGARRPDLAAMGGGHLLDVAAKERAVAARGVAAAAAVAAVGDGRGLPGRLCGGGSLGLGPGVRLVGSGVQGQWLGLGSGSGLGLRLRGFRARGWAQAPRVLGAARLGVARSAPCTPCARSTGALPPSETRRKCTGQSAWPGPEGSCGWVVRRRARSQGAPSSLLARDAPRRTSRRER